MAMRLPGSRRDDEVALRRLAASLCRGPSPGAGREVAGAAEEEEASSFEAERGGGGEGEEGSEKGQERCCCRCCCGCLLSFPALPEKPSAAAARAASLLLTIRVIIDDVGHAKLASEVLELLAAAAAEEEEEAEAAACWTCEAVLCAERASAAPSVDQLPATVSAVSSRVRAAALAALCREAWAVFRAASSSRACFFVKFFWKAEKERER